MQASTSTSRSSRSHRCGAGSNTYHRAARACSGRRSAAPMLDSLSRHPQDSEFVADLCVVGAGPAGLALAREFLEGAARVLLVDSGGEAPRAVDQRLNAG